MNAEKSALLAEKLLKKEYPADKIKSVWEDIMFNQFHDILGGCCIKDAYYDARNLHGRALQTAEETMYYSLQSITNKIKMPGKNPDNAWNLVVWNLNGSEFDGEIEAEVQWAWEFDWYDGGIMLTDSDNNEYECQIIEELPVVPRFRSRFIFKAKIPAYGYKSFVVKQTGTIEKQPLKKTCENGRFFIEYDENGIKTVYDKTAKKEIVKEMLVPYAVADECDTWGFNKTVYEKEKEFLKLKECGIKENGSVRTVLRLEWEFNTSSLVQEIGIYENHIDCSYRVLWNEERKALKFAVSNGKKMKCVCSAPYGKIEREQSEYEKPMNEWVKLCNGDENITVIADSIFAYNFDGSELGLTVLRNCIFGDLRMAPLNENRKYQYMGQGETEGRIRIVFEGNADIEGVKFNNPPVIMCEANHGGIFEPQASFIEISENIMLGTLKKAECGNGYVCRLYNTADCVTTGKISLFGNNADVCLKPHEIQSIHNNEEKFVKINILEEIK